MSFQAVQSPPPGSSPTPVPQCPTCPQSIEQAPGSIPRFRLFGACRLSPPQSQSRWRFGYAPRQRSPGAAAPQWTFRAILPLRSQVGYQVHDNVSATAENWVEPLRAEHWSGMSKSRRALRSCAVLLVDQRSQIGQRVVERLGPMAHRILFRGRKLRRGPTVIQLEQRVITEPTITPLLESNAPIPLATKIPALTVRSTNGYD